MKLTGEATREVAVADPVPETLAATMTTSPISLSASTVALFPAAATISLEEVHFFHAEKSAWGGVTNIIYNMYNIS